MHGLLNVGRLPSYTAFGTSPRFTSRGPVGGPPVNFGRMSCHVAQSLWDGPCMCDARNAKEGFTCAVPSQTSLKAGNEANDF